MMDLYHSNRKRAQSYRDDLIARLGECANPETFSAAAGSDLQPFYLEFKKRVSGLIDEETARLKDALTAETDAHFLLLQRSALADAVVQTAFQTALWLHNRLHSSSLQAGDLRVALVGRGGYGREEMYFASKVDLKMVFQDEQGSHPSQPGPQVIKLFEYLFVFQDLFPATARTGCAVLETETEKIATSNLESLMSLLEHRFIAGDETVYWKFSQSLQSAKTKHHEKILDYCRRFETMYDVQSTVFHQEPNLKEELRRLYWALCLSRTIHDLRKINQFELLQELHQRDYLSTPVYKLACNALNFLARVRLALHCHQQGAQRDRLTYEVRETVARTLHFPVAPFFKEYFFNTVLPLKRCARNLFWECLTADSAPVLALSPDFALNRDQQIIFSNPEGDHAWDPPWTVLELFTWVSGENYSLSYPVIRAIEQNVGRMLETLHPPADPSPIQAYFQNILRGKHFARALRYLHEFGLLERFFLPEFKNLSGLLQDIYVHLFPTDVHILTALDALNQLDLQAHADPFLVDLYQSLKSKTALRLGVLLHDIGKGLKKPGENEELVGARAAPGILERLGYGKDRKLIATVSFLVEKHLMMRDLMMLDPDADDTYEMIWDLVNQDVDRLRMLILLTYADRSATKMVLSNSQINQLRYFYQNTIHHKKTESVPHQVKTEFLRMIRLPRNIQEQLNVYLAFKKSKEGFAMDFIFRVDEPSELVVCNRDQPDLLYKVATVLAFNQLSIGDARIHTLGGNAFDVFQIAGPGQEPIDVSNFFTIQKKVREDLFKVCVENLPMAELYRGRDLTPHPIEDRFAEVKLKVSIIGRAVKLETHDILGTMMMETKVFSQLDMVIQRAVLNTNYRTASNIFYLRSEDVHEIMSDEEKFKGIMINALQPLLRGGPIFPDSAGEVA